MSALIYTYATSIQLCIVWKKDVGNACGREGNGRGDEMRGKRNEYGGRRRENLLAVQVECWCRMG